MRFEPKSEEQIAEEGLLLPGIYDFEISAAENQTSKAGNEMIKLTLNVFDEEGNRRQIFDYLLENFPRKLRHAAEACGLLERYHQGEILAIDFEGKTGRVRIGKREDKTGQFPPQNTVVDYVLNPPKVSPKTKVAAGDLDDEIPF